MAAKKHLWQAHGPTLEVAIAILAAIVGFSAPAAAQTQIAARISAVPQSHPLTKALRFGRDALETMEDVSDYTAVFAKKEILGGRLVEHHMQIRFREEPMSVHLKYIEPHAGREVLYVEGRNDGEIQVKDTGLIALVGPISLEPTHPIAMKETVYPITAIGIRNMLERLLEHWLRETANGSDDVIVKFYPDAHIGNCPCEVIEAIHPKPAPQHDYHKVRLYVDKETGVPIRIQHLGFPNRPGATPPVTGDYAYLNLETNVGLTDEDFALDQ